MLANLFPSIRPDQSQARGPEPKTLGRDRQDMHLFTVHKLYKCEPCLTTDRGVTPFLASDVLLIVLLALAPSVCLWLVRLST